MRIALAKRTHRVEEYYFSRKLAEIREMNMTGEPILNLGIGSPDLPPSPDVIKALAESAAKPENHGYQSYRGTNEFRKAIAEFYATIYGVSLDPEKMILPLMGSKEGIMHISLAFLNEGDEVWVPDPGYLTYGSVAQLIGAKVRTYPLLPENNFQIDFDWLSMQDFSRSKIFWVNSPHMPTGTVWEKESLLRLLKFAREKNFLVVNDNPYSMILNEDPVSLLSVKEFDEVSLELNSLSKSHNMAGWRLGWVAGHEDYINAILKVKSNMDSGMFLALQQAAAQALKLNKVWSSQLNSIYKERQKVALAIVELLGCTYYPNQKGLFLWAKAPEAVDDVENWVDLLLHSTRVFITPGFIFGKNGLRFIRISLCNSVEIMKEAAERIKSRFLVVQNVDYG